MRTRNRLKVALIVLLASASIAGAQAVDVIAATLNGSPFCGMTLDQTTSELGRPTAVEAASDFLKDTFGPQIYYHGLGMRIEFRPGATGEEPARSLLLHVARTWDEENLEWYQAFPGALTPAANADWRIDRTMRELASLQPIEKSPDFQRAEWTAAGIGKQFHPDNPFYMVTVEFEDGRRINLLHEPITRFLEQVILLCPSR